MTNHQVKTKDEISQNKNIQQLREGNQMLKQIQQEYSIKDKGMMAKYKEFKKSSTGIFHIFDIICDFFEKSKNLIKWEEPRITKYFFLFLIIAFIFVTFFPLRFLIILFLTYKFYRGQFYHRKRIRNNKEVCRIEFMNCLDDNRLKLQSQNLGEKWEMLLGKQITVKNLE